MDPQASHRRNVLFWLQLLLASLDEEVYRAIPGDRKSTRLNSSHGYISYAVFCLKKKIVHSWKEVLLLLLSLMAAAAFIRAWRAGHLPRPNLFDLLVAVVAAVVVIYTVLPPTLLHGSANLQQRVIGLRVLLLLPLLYLFGRVFQPRSRADLRWVAWAILGSAAAVGLFGLWELWLVPTPDSFGWGVHQPLPWLGLFVNLPN